MPSALDANGVPNSVAAAANQDSEAIQLGLALSLPEAAISGSITLEVEDSFLIAPVIKVNLGGVKAYVSVALNASAAVYESIELVASDALSLTIPGLLDFDLSAGLALDLVVGVSAAVDVTAGFSVVFPEDCFIEISLLTNEIVNIVLDGLIAESLPAAIGADVDLSTEIELNLGLRLRAGLDLSAVLEIVDLNIGAGGEVAIWVSLFDYSTVLVETSECPCSASEAFALACGVAVNLDVEVGDILQLSLAPSVFVTLATAPTAESCLPIGGVLGGLPGSGSASGSGSSSNHGSSSGSGGSGSGSAVGSGSTFATTLSTIVETAASPITATRAGSGAGSTTTIGGDLITSTVTSTAKYTVTSCAASVANCPASYTQHVVTSVVSSYTTVCPATMASSSVSATSVAPVTVPAQTSPVSLTSCATPSTSTVVVPSTCPTPAPTVVIVNTTTVPASRSTTVTTVSVVAQTTVSSSS